MSDTTRPGGLPRLESIVDAMRAQRDRALNDLALAQAELADLKRTLAVRERQAKTPEEAVARPKPAAGEDEQT